MLVGRSSNEASMRASPCIPLLMAQYAENQDLAGVLGSLHSQHVMRGMSRHEILWLVHPCCWSGEGNDGHGKGYEPSGKGEAKALS